MTYLPLRSSACFSAVAAVLAAFVVSCSTAESSVFDDPPTPPPADAASPPANPFTPSLPATRVVIEIDFQKGAEPYTGSTVAFGETWRLFETNAAKLFEGSGKTVEVPTALDRMERLDDVEGKQFSTEAILAIAGKHRQGRTAGDTIAYYVVWLDGYFEQNGTPNQQVLGVSIGRTGVIAMFKPVIKSAGIALVPDVARAVEQTTLVHEFGHAVGLVANGIPVTSAHHDTAHEGHCTNDACVMYFSVEGVDAARDYAQRNVTRADTVLFGDECLADVVAARR